MSVIVASLQGRFGNQVTQYLFCRAFAEEFGHELRVEPWIGERVFAIEHPRPDGRAVQRVNEFGLLANRTHAPDSEFRGYAQMQICMSYSKRQAQQWLRLRPEIYTACRDAVGADDGANDRVVCHRRAGDYFGYGYPVVSVASYSAACEQFGLARDSRSTTFLCEEDSTPHAGYLPDDLAFMADFYRMMMAPTLLRGNSSFSWLAALLGNGLVLSPVIAGLEGGKEHLCQFVAGNHPRLANFDFTTDLYVSP